jgi:serine protease Do
MTIHQRFRLFIGVGLLAFVCVAGASRSFAMDARPELSFADIAARVKSSVVTVAAAAVDARQAGRLNRGRESRAEGGEAQSFEDFSPLRPKRGPGEPVRQFTSIGSGFIIDSSGLIVTNNHVIEGGNAIYVILSDGSELKVDKVIGRDPKTDVTLLKVTPKASKPLHAVPFGDSGRMRVGDWVIAIGNPFGLSNTVTTGVVSALHRSIKKDDEQYENFIQTDASINPGNSGGPLLNIKGELIGINTAIYGEAQGIGFAIPVNTAKRIINDLLRYGEVRSPWLGIYVQNLNRKIAQQYSYPGKYGVMITTVLPASPAYQAGLKRGDIITAIEQQPVKSKESFATMLYSYTADNTIALSVFRDSSQKEYAIKAIAFPISLVDEVCWKVLGIAVMENSAAVAKKYGLYADQGVIIKSTQDNGQAEQRGLKPGDIMLQINENEIKNMEDFKKNIARNAQRETILVLIQRGPYGYYLNLEMVP